MGDALHDAVIDSTEEIMKMFSREIKSIEKNIHVLIEGNKDLNNSYELVTSVVGIGFATAVHFIIATENLKKLKTLLTMASICAVRFDPGLKAKYHQKVGEGKPKMSVLNIIRAKLIERIFTVVKRGSPYEIRLAA